MAKKGNKRTREIFSEVSAISDQRYGDGKPPELRLEEGQNQAKPARLGRVIGTS